MEICVNAQSTNKADADLFRNLCGESAESEWLEFKENKALPQEIGQYISALANSAAINGKTAGYLLWGIRNGNREIVGTKFRPATAKKGNQNLEVWLLQLLNPKIDFRFRELTVDGKLVVLLEIPRATRQPVRFEHEAFIRIGSAKRKLREYPEKEQALWRAFDQTPFEQGVAVERATAEDVLRLLDYPSYFDLLHAPLPSNRDQILEALAADRLVLPRAGGWDITNLAAILFAKQLRDFPRISRKATRVIQYHGQDRIQTLRTQEGTKGYACGFEGLAGYINNLIPSNEIIGEALRRTVPMFPELAVRELVANALIHQDFLVAGAGPTIEIFRDRMEITNPGEPLVDTRHFMDAPPRSRNEDLAAMMRRFGICEEQGSGIDKVVAQVEIYQLPAPLFETPPGFTRATLFAHRNLKKMSKSDRVRACYWHACLCYVTRTKTTNATIRKRFGISEQNAADASHLLNEARDAGVIVIENTTVGTKSRSYLPFWAKSATQTE
jgi:predicted HTH transcriptional regulator